MANGRATFIEGVRLEWAKLAHFRDEMFWVLLGQIMTLVGGIVGIKVLTNVMGPEKYGEMALGITIAGLLNLFVYGPISSTALRFFSIYREKGKLPIYFYVLKTAHQVVGFLVGGLLLLGTWLTALWVGGDWALVVGCAGLFGMISGLSASVSAVQGALRQRKALAIHQAADAWLRPVIAAGTIALFWNTGYVALLGFAIGTLVVTLSQTAWLRGCPDISEFLKPSQMEREQLGVSAHAKGFYEYAQPFVLWGGIAGIGMYADRWILQGLLGPTEVGIYVAIHQIARAPISILNGTINQFLMPILFDRAGAMRSRVQAEGSTRLLYQSIALVSLLLITMVVAAHHWSGFFEIGQTFTVVGHTHKRTQPYILPFVISASVSLGLAYFLGRLHGIAGVAWGVCIANFLYMLLVIKTNMQVIAEARLIHGVGSLQGPTPCKK